MRSLRAQAAITAGAVFLLVLALRFVGALERVELSIYDLALRARPSVALDERFIIVDETDEDIERFGHPLSDQTLAQAIERLLLMKPRVLAIDKFRDIPVPPGSAALERTVNANRNVYWVYQFGGQGAHRVVAPKWLERRAQAAFNDILPDVGGTVRRGLLFLDDGGRPQRSLSLALATAYLASQGIAPKADPDDPARMRFGAASLAPLEAWDGGYAGTDASGWQYLLDYRGAPARFPSVTLGELLDGKVDATLVLDRIVILGSNATSLKDFFQTPFSTSAQPYNTGSELLAHQTSQLLRLALGESKPIRTLPEWTELLLLALCCALGLAAWAMTHPASLAALIAGGLAALAAIWYAAATVAIWFPILPLMLGFVASAATSAGLRALHEARERAAMMAMFSRHVAPEVARELWRRREGLTDGYALRPQHLDATVLFADLHGYSPVAARLAPVDTARWLNEFLAPMADVIMAHRGVIRQFAGDAIMAVFGAPIPSETRAEQERDARTSVACAREMQRCFAELNETWRRDGKPTAGMRIGLYSGPMVGCSIGSRQRLEYTVIGDTVNMAARLQALALPDGDEGERGRILIGDTTRALLPVHEPCERIGSFVLKGRSEATSVYRIVGE